MAFYKTPVLIRKTFKKAIWQNKSKENIIYLTFDDGPIPEITPWVLDQLQQFNAKATFFMVGENIVKHRDIYNLVLDGGHTIGNHTQNHLVGWQTNNNAYFENIKQAEAHIALDSKKLFRPPHGRLKWSQYLKISREYQVVMWDVLSNDFQQNISPQNCLENTIKATESGSVVVFHDSIKSNKNLAYALPEYLKYFTQKGFKFSAL